MDLECSEELPTYSDFVRVALNRLKTLYHEEFVEIRTPIELDSWNITAYDMICVALMISVLSTLRFIITKRVFMPIANHYDIPEASRQKVPECAWKFTYYLCVWCYEWYVVVLSGKYTFFQKPKTMWEGWSLDAIPEGDIYFIYIVECAFLLHSTYTTVFLDAWKKDTFVLIFHHVSSLILIFISQATRCHHVGAFIFFLHDVCDIFMEFAKLCSYFRIQRHKVQDWIEMMGKFAFACFIATWFTTRLYWYPLKVGYSAAVHPLELNLHIPHFFIMGILGLGILTLNVYWSMWILIALYRVANGKKEDPREADMMTSSEQVISGKNYSSNILKETSKKFCSPVEADTILKETQCCHLSSERTYKNK